MADGFDRSGFVLDRTDCNLLYKDRFVDNDVFTKDIF